MDEINFEMFDNQGNWRGQNEMPTPVFPEGCVFAWEMDEDDYAMYMVRDASEYEEMLEFIANFI